MLCGDEHQKGAEGKALVVAQDHERCTPHSISSLPQTFLVELMFETAYSQHFLRFLDPGPSNLQMQRNIDPLQ